MKKRCLVVLKYRECLLLEEGFYLRPSLPRELDREIFGALNEENWNDTT
jgi:hypothetical protein